MRKVWDGGGGGSQPAGRKSPIHFADGGQLGDIRAVAAGPAACPPYSKDSAKALCS